MADAGTPDRSFRRRILVVLTLVVAVVLASGVGSYLGQRRRIESSVTAQLASIADLKCRSIAAWRGERLADTAMAMDSTPLGQAATGFLAEPTTGLRDQLLAHFTSLRDHYHYQDILLVDAAGRVHLNLDGAVDPLPANAMATLAEAGRDHRPMLTELHRTAEGQPIHFEGLAPFYGGPGAEATLVGAIVLRIDANEFLYPMIQEWPVPSDTAESLLVRIDGDGVLFLNELRHRHNTALDLRLPLSRDDLPAVMAAKGQRGIVRGKDYRGTEVLASLGAVEGSPWLLVAKVDASEVFAGWGLQSLLILALTLALVAVATAVAAMLWHREERRLLQEQIEARAALARSEDRYRATLLSIGDAVIATDRAGRVEIMNRVAEELTGWPADEARGQPLGEVFRIVNETTRATVENPVDKVLREGVVAGLANHTVLLARDGREWPIADSGAPIWDGEGAITGVVLVFRDQTAERETERALLESEWLLRESQTIAGLGSYVLDIRTGLWTSSPVLDELFGIDDDYARSVEGWAALIDPQCREGMRRYFEDEVIAAKGRFDRQYRIQRRDTGELRWVHGKGELEFDGSGEPIRMLGTIEDVTERAAAEQRLEHRAAVDAALAELSAELLQTEATHEQLAEAVLRHARHLTASEHGFASSIEAKTGENVYHAWTGMGGEECRRGRANGEMVFPRGDDGTYPALWGYPLNTREPLLTNSPASHPASTGVPEDHIPLKNLLSVPVIADDELVGQIAVANADRDYTADDLAVIRRLAGLYGLALRDRRMRGRIQESETQLRRAQRMESVGRLAGGVAHDFNNMLQTMLGSAELALAEVEPGSEIASYLDEIVGAGQRSAALTSQLLAFARQQTISPKRLDLNEAVAGTMRMLGRLIGEDIQIVWRPTSKATMVLMDPAQVDQILANLVVNARDAIAGVGTIVIETGTQVIVDDEAEAPSWSAPGDYVVLSVSDDGCGMDETTMANVFEPFFTTKEQGQGTGLGLATVYGIVKQNDGFVNLYSEPGQGTTFRIYLPRREGEAREAESAAATQAAPGGDETVLLVEDEPSLLLLAQRLLGQLGYTVLAAGSPEDALRLAKDHPGDIDLLITDVVMPGMSGRDLSQCLLDVRPDLKCLFMSGYTADVITQRGVLDEGIQFLQKPFTRQVLAVKVREVIDDAGLPD